MLSAVREFIALTFAICLRQDDFESGTKIISEPGNYKLCEDIKFSPELVSFDPAFDEPYNTNAYELGFFSAIAITSSNVNLFLNGHTIEQSAQHALLQRFFAVIELANSPFIKSAGPAQFIGEGELFVPANNVKILGPGTVGRSSHHGIHGNDNNHITIKNIIFRDFEVAAVSLNNVDSVEIKNCEVTNNRHDVPVVGLFSAARFLRPYGKFLSDVDYRMDIRGVSTSARELHKNLISSINNVYNDVILGEDGRINKNTHPKEYQLFHNPFGVVDGPCYVFLIHGKGPAVAGQGEIFNEFDDTVTSSNVIIENNRIENIKCWNNEIPAVVESGVVLIDPRGSVFQLLSAFNTESPSIAINSNGTYKGNVVADMQVMVAAAILDGTLEDAPERQTAVNSISEAVVAWAQSGVATFSPHYRCNGDSMHHVVKGMIIIRVEDTKGFSIKGNSINNVTNLSVEPFGMCDDYHEGSSSENEWEQQAGNIRAISVAAVRGFDDSGLHFSEINNNNIHFLTSEEANVIIGIDIQGDSREVTVEKNRITLQAGAGEDLMDKCISLRIRQFADIEDEIVLSLKEKNSFSEEVQIEESVFTREGDHHGLSREHTSGRIEWSTGRCPAR